jgi:hypothetical protein
LPVLSLYLPIQFFTLLVLLPNYAPSLLPTIHPFY